MSWREMTEDAMEEEYHALLEVAEAAAVLIRPPYRRGAGVGINNPQERDDWARLRKALYQDDCPVDIGEVLT